MDNENSFRDLIVYKKAFELAMEIFKLTKTFPKEELYSLSDQIRRSSRSVCSSIAEAYRKRRYPAHFISKISDADMENSETIVWLDFAENCGYLKKSIKIELENKCIEIGKLLNHMIIHPEKYQRKI
ncbi:four helix bundle protein [Melioribacteraceae bacterium 4301-Me]|uniref:four helix bundle protein n=1 Tax=Pyranulibacter aquaticus TaxID=3163344 RepID=UPI003599B43F